MMKDKRVLLAALGIMLGGLTTAHAQEPPASTNGLQLSPEVRSMLQAEMLQNPVAIVELAVDKKASTILMPASARRALNDLPDEYWTKTNIEFYSEPADAVFKALVE